MPKASQFDQIWIENRYRYRKGMRGTAMRLDEATGYLEPMTRRGFSAEMKDIFIKRFTVCSNKRAICRSLFIDVGSVYDAIAIDKKFREDYLKCDSIIKRNTQLNDELVVLANSEKKNIVDDLTSKLDKYSK